METLKSFKRHSKDINTDIVGTLGNDASTTVKKCELQRDITSTIVGPSEESVPFSCMEHLSMRKLSFGYIPRLHKVDQRYTKSDFVVW